MGGNLVLTPDIVELVLPAVAGVTVKAAVDVTVDWLRGLRKKPIQGEKVVLIYGSRGEPLSKVRLRAGDAAPGSLRSTLAALNA